MQDLLTYLSNIITTTDTYQEWKYNSKYKYYAAKFGKPNEQNENLWIPKPFVTLWKVCGEGSPSPKCEKMTFTSIAMVN